MDVTERSVKVPKQTSNWDRGLTEYFRRYFRENNTLENGERLVRMIVIETDDEFYHCEIQVARGDAPGYANMHDPLTLFPRGIEDTSTFNVALVIPTGIDSEIGGEDGDATPVARMLAQDCDNLILHPNVVNASDLNEMPSNSLYVEGNTLSRFLYGVVGLKKVRSNKILLVVDETEFTDYSINSVGAARASFGIDCEVLRIKDLYRSEVKYTGSGRASGEVRDIDKMLKVVWDYRSKHGFDALAISSYIHAPKGLAMRYFSEDMINPWGGVEAMITHSVSQSLELPTAHAPMMEDLETMNQELPVVHPRKAAEAVSITFLHCVLKGLHKSPQIITKQDQREDPSVLTAKNVSALVIPEGCLGQPVLAAIDQGIPIIAVKNKNIMKNDLSKLVHHSRYVLVDSYMEASGVLSAMKAGVALETMRRPLEYTKVTVNGEQD